MFSYTKTLAHVEMHPQTKAIPINTASIGRRLPSCPLLGLAKKKETVAKNRVLVTAASLRMALFIG